MKQTPPLHHIVTVLVTALAWAGTAGAQTVVTSVTGNVESGEGAVAVNAVMPENETFETEGDGHCSLMVAGEAVVQLCNAASVTFHKRGRSRVMEVTQGELKATVGPRASDQPLEIHTPVAIATLLGTVVHVSVDPETGETTITSLENRVRVQGVEEGLMNPIVLEPNQQVTIRRGEAPGKVRAIDASAAGDVSDCMLSDIDLRQVAVAGARAAQRRDSIAEIALADIPDLSLPGVSASFEAASADAGVFDASENPRSAGDRDGADLGFEDPISLGVIDPTDSGGGKPNPPPACSGRPGDHCQF